MSGKLRELWNRGVKHFRDFHFVWILLIALLLIARWQSESITWWFYGAVVLFVAYLVWRPMGAVYGLMGTTGSISLFFIIFIVISTLFSCVYYYGFFDEAGISYDVNQPHLDYRYYHHEDGDDSIIPEVRTVHVRDTVISFRLGADERMDTVVTVSSETRHYQHIDFWFIFRNTIMTSLMQEPTDFYATAATYNAAMDSAEHPSNTQVETLISIDEMKASLFHWILIIQVLISWLFFGVFISLLYTKFRYES